MRIREYAHGVTVSGRNDIGVLYALCFLDDSLFVEDGANFKTDGGITANRNQLVKGKY